MSSPRFGNGFWSGVLVGVLALFAGLNVLAITRGMVADVTTHVLLVAGSTICILAEVWHARRKARERNGHIAELAADSVVLHSMLERQGTQAPVITHHTRHLH